MYVQRLEVLSDEDDVADMADVADATMGQTRSSVCCNTCTLRTFQWNPGVCVLRASVLFMQDLYYTPRTEYTPCDAMYEELAQQMFEGVEDSQLSMEMIQTCLFNRCRGQQREREHVDAVSSVIRTICAVPLSQKPAAR